MRRRDWRIVLGLCGLCGSLATEAGAQGRLSVDGVVRYDRGYRGYDVVQPIGPPLILEPQPAAVDTYRPYALPGTVHVPMAQVYQQADTLVVQVNAFLQVFTPTVHVVPDGERFLSDALLLNTAATRFRDLAAIGAHPAQLSAELNGLERIWSRMARRTDRIARGRIGPNIQQIYWMGDTLAQIRQVLP